MKSGKIFKRGPLVSEVEVAPGHYRRRYKKVLDLDAMKKAKGKKASKPSAPKADAYKAPAKKAAPKKAAPKKSAPKKAAPVKTEEE